MPSNSSLLVLVDGVVNGLGVVDDLLGVKADSCRHGGDQPDGVAGHEGPDRQAQRRDQARQGRQHRLQAGPGCGGGRGDHVGPEGQQGHASGDQVAAQLLQAFPEVAAGIEQRGRALDRRERRRSELLTEALLEDQHLIGELHLGSFEAVGALSSGFIRHALLIQCRTALHREAGYRLWSCRCRRRAGWWPSRTPSEPKMVSSVSCFC